MDDSLDVTVLLRRLRDGDADAAAAMAQAVYQDLRQIARNLMRQDHGNTLQPTALVHEAWLKLQRALQNGAEVADRRHFFAVASRAMRQILVNHARDRSAQKRGGDAARIALDDCLDEQAVPVERITETAESHRESALGFGVAPRVRSAGHRGQLDR